MKNTILILLASIAFFAIEKKVLVKEDNSWFGMNPDGTKELLYSPTIYILKENLFFTTSNTFEDIINEDVVLAEGDYEILLTAQGNGDATGSDFWIDFNLDGSAISAQSSTIHRQESKDIAGNATTPYSNQALPVIYRGVKTLSAGTHNFNPMIKAEVSGVECGVFNFILSIKRIEGTIIQG